MPMTFLVELILTVLLAATLFYCVMLERRLAALRSGQDGLKQTLSALNGAVASAGTSIQALKSTAHEITQSLDSRLSHARGLADELGVLVGSGERIAERIAGKAERAATSAQNVGMEMGTLHREALSTEALPSASIMQRLDAGRMNSFGAMR